MKIAVLDHDSLIQKLICSLLESDDHTTYVFNNISSIQNHLRNSHTDLLILNCADASGFLAEIKTSLPTSMPILLMINRSPEQHLINDLATFADDYIIKPIRQNELATRVRVLLHRFYPGQLPESVRIKFGDYVFETHHARIWRSGQPIIVTQKEFDLALFLFQNIGNPLSRAFILETLWAQEPEIPSRTLDTHISRVRNKLQLNPENGFQLTPVYGFGYQLLPCKNQ